MKYRDSAGTQPYSQVAALLQNDDIHGKLFSEMKAVNS